MDNQYKYIKYKLKYKNTKKSKKIKHLYIISDSQTKWDIGEIEQYLGNKTPLTNNGKKQAIKTGEYLYEIAQREKFNYDLILSSPNTIKTSEIISKEIKYKDTIQTNNNLIQNDNISDNIGDTVNEIQEYIAEMDRYDMLDIIERNQENELSKDVRHKAETIIKLINKSNKERIIIVSHYHIIDTLNQVILNTNDQITGDLKNGIFCHLTYYQINDKNRWKLICAPNTLHLE